MIDWDRVRELFSEVGEDDFHEIVALFLEEVKDVADRLRASPEMTSLAEDLHFLKGCALNLGFSGLSELCQAGESTAAGGAPELVDLKVILSVYDASREEFVAQAPSRMAA